MAPRARRLPKSRNQEAYVLSNSETRHLDLRKCIYMDIAIVGSDLSTLGLKCRAVHLTDLEHFTRRRNLRRRPSGSAAEDGGDGHPEQLFILDDLLSRRSPLGLVLMEVAHRMKKRRTVLMVWGPPRSQNQEADALTYMELRHFVPE